MAHTFITMPLSRWALLALLFSIACPTSAEIAIITHPSLKASKLSIDDTAKLFLNTNPVLPDGTRVTLIAQSTTTESAKEFNNKVLHKKDQELRAYWARIIFSGSGQPPKTVDSDKTVKNMVASTPSAIGYIDVSAVDTSVKVILLVP